MRLDGKVAMVTGAAQGIGEGIALRFAREGASVVVADINGERARGVARRIEEAGGVALACGMDVTKRDQVRAAVQAAVERFGRIDILVNNAGITRDAMFFKMTEDEWDQVMAVHLKGAFNCTQEVQQHMVKNNYGKIVMISSNSAEGNRGQANYSAAKAGLQGLTRTLAIELGRFNINVNCVAPGFVDTEMTRETGRRLGFTDPEEFKKARAATIPLGRVGTPEDIADVVLFFASDESSYVNGQVLYVRGGPR